MASCRSESTTSLTDKGSVLSLKCTISLSAFPPSLGSLLVGGRGFGIGHGSSMMKLLAMNDEYTFVFLKRIILNNEPLLQTAGVVIPSLLAPSNVAAHSLSMPAMPA